MPLPVCVGQYLIDRVFNLDAQAVGVLFYSLLGHFLYLDQRQPESFVLVVDVKEVRHAMMIPSNGWRSKIC